MAGRCSMEEVVRRFLELEASQARLRDQLQVIIEGEEERRRRNARRRRRQMMMVMSRTTSLPPSGGDGRPIRGFFPTGRFADGLYGSVLKHIGHALHVCRSDTGEIIFWNPSAEDLYGWKVEEALGKRVEDLFPQGESGPDLEEIMEHYVARGRPWSGILPFTKRSGETVLAVATKAPVFDDEEGGGAAVTGIVTVAIDATLLLPRSPSDQNLLLDEDPALNFSRSRSYGDVEHQLSPAGSRCETKQGFMIQESE